MYNTVQRALDADPDVDDVVQDVMLQVVRGLPALRRPESVRAWILAIAVRRIGALALLNAVFRLCLGCELYLLGRRLAGAPAERRTPANA